MVVAPPPPPPPKMLFVSVVGLEAPNVPELNMLPPVMEGVVLALFPALAAVGEQMLMEPNSVLVVSAAAVVVGVVVVVAGEVAATGAAVAVTGVPELAAGVETVADEAGVTTGLPRESPPKENPPPEDDTAAVEVVEGAAIEPKPKPVVAVAVAVDSSFPAVFAGSVTGEATVAVVSVEDLATPKPDDAKLLPPPNVNPPVAAPLAGFTLPNSEPPEAASPPALLGVTDSEPNESPENNPPPDAAGLAPPSSFAEALLVAPDGTVGFVTLPNSPPVAKLPLVPPVMLPNRPPPAGLLGWDVAPVAPPPPLPFTERSTDESTFCSRLVRAGRGAFVAGAGSTGPNDGGSGLSFCTSSTGGGTFSFAVDAVAVAFGLPRLSGPSEAEEDPARPKERPPLPAVADGASKEKFGFGMEPKVSPDCWPLLLPVPELPKENTVPNKQIVKHHAFGFFWLVRKS